MCLLIHLSNSPSRLRRMTPHEAPSTSRDGRYVIENAKAVKHDATESLHRTCADCAEGKFASQPRSALILRNARRARLEGQGRLRLSRRRGYAGSAVSTNRTQ